MKDRTWKMTRSHNDKLYRLSNWAAYIKVERDRPEKVFYTLKKNP